MADRYHLYLLPLQHAASQKPDAGPEAKGMEVRCEEGLSDGGWCGGWEETTG